MNTSRTPTALTPYILGQRGIIMLPLRRNVPKPAAKDWKLVNCPICGEQCWQSGVTRAQLESGNGIVAFCTICAIREGGNPIQ